MRFEIFKFAGKPLDVPHAKLDAGVIGHLRERLSFGIGFFP